MPFASQNQASAWQLLILTAHLPPPCVSNSVQNGKIEPNQGGGGVCKVKKQDNIFKQYIRFLLLFSCSIMSDSRRPHGL